MPEETVEPTIPDPVADTTPPVVETPPPTDTPAETTPPASSDPLQIPEAPEPEAAPQITAEFLASEWTANEGSLTEATLDRLTKAGIAPELVSQFVAGQEALAATANAKIHETLGGEEQSKALLDWAGTNLDESTKTALNSQLASPDINVRVLAAQALKSLHAQKAGSIPLVSGSNGTALTGYRSDAEMTKDMQDPRYRNDPAFRAEVAARIKAGLA